MHAYQLQKLLQERGMDKIVNVRRLASVYQALEQMVRLGLIEVQTRTEREGHSNRVVYGITDRGREMARVWAPKMLAIVGADYPEFPAAASLLNMLSPEDALKQFEARAQSVRNELSRLGVGRMETEQLPRLYRLRNEYRTALLEAELAWIQTVIVDLASGLFVWGDRKRRDTAASVTQGFTHEIEAISETP